ncbi:MAG: DinB family protein [Sporichthyaceae bacterium]|nr:DinB family protein [Sporichthyaceae bacterium]
MTVRPMPPQNGMDTEVETLLAYQEGQRRHVLGILDGLSEADLRRPVLPSGWSCLGLVSHLALDIERFWFRAVMAGEQTAIDELAATTDAWLVGPDVPAEQVVGSYLREIELANAVISSTPAHAAPAWWPAELFGSWRLDNLREILLHVITETACHAGHLDAARELIDGRLWRVLA